MKTLSYLLSHTTSLEVIGPRETVVGAIVFDSREVATHRQADATVMYVAQRGTQTDGHRYIDNAIGDGAGVVVCETLPENIHSEVTYVRVADGAIALGELAAAFYDFPSKKLKLVGITGTNGKTTTVTLLHRLFTEMKHATGLISTIVNKVKEREIATSHTTPDALTLNELLSEMVSEGCEYCFMEVSSHAICQHRIAGLQFAGGIFSNITHDHLDFHKTFANYIQAKKAFFDGLPANAFALTNVDDKNGLVMVQNTAAAVHRYGLQHDAEFKGKILENAFEGLHLQVNGTECFFRLSGRFNAYNLLAIYGTAVLLGGDKDDILMKMSNLGAAEGRFHVIRNGRGGVAVIDYAHTPDALENVLTTIRDITNADEEVLTVVGCGGNRDALKRPVMAGIACKYSSRVILTSDNPRWEDPNEILRQMEAGVPDEKRDNTLVIENRHSAIQTACMMLADHGVILIAGKGHEKYQDAQGVKHHFDDSEEVCNNWKIPYKK
ncbi:MAG: UDP-N-acetylmuramoyl-L-alanyl-D-glutamate--2,6-diaminopimelate ligase [Bacteroidales bacterium]|nr:UDP-N-acetylmuramoyl-L-alanyl-D-glutamate--2,6-diaminopimelate ligase [Bacteroidales bacterium]